MKGHDALTTMRLAGAVPLTVDVLDGQATTAAREWPAIRPQFAVLAIDADEPLHALDLRCLVGMPVQVSSSNRDRLGQLLRRIKAEAPARLIGTLFDDRQRLVAVYDSEGIATWPTC